MKENTNHNEKGEKNKEKKKIRVVSIYSYWREIRKKKLFATEGKLKKIQIITNNVKTEQKY